MNRKRSGAGKPPAVRLPCRPRLEVLEDRLTPSGLDTLSQAQSVPFDPASQTALVSGSLADPNQVDLYAVQLDRGDEVTAQVNKDALNPPDTGLRVFDSSGQQLAFSFNPLQFRTGAVDSPPLIFDAPENGVFYIGVSSGTNFSYDPLVSGTGSGGDSTGDYRLTLTRQLALTQESEAAGVTGQNDSPDTADQITALTHLTGTLGSHDIDTFFLDLQQNGVLHVTVTPRDKGVLLPSVALYGNQGRLLVQADGTAGGDGVARLSLHVDLGHAYLAISAVTEPTDPNGDCGYVLDTWFEPADVPFFPVPAGPGPLALTVGDFNNDGKLDVVTINSLSQRSSYTASVFLGLGDGTFAPASIFSTGGPPSAIASGDFNHDGNLDLAITNQAANRVLVFLGRGNGTFGPATPFPVGCQPSSVAVADVNGDGIPDLVTAGSGDSTVSVLLGNGDGSFAPPKTFAAGARPSSVAIGDVNGDGRLDLVVANSGDNSVSVLLGNGDGSFRTAAAVAVGNAPSSVQLADLNCDGKLDLVTANSGDNSVSVLLGNGQGSFRPAGTLEVGLDPSSVAVADFNHDGKLDLVVANTSDNTVSVLLGHGDGSFQPARTLAVGYSPTCVAAALFDGQVDLITTDRDQNTLSVLLGHGDGTFLPDDPGQVGRQPVAVITGDFNGDGHLDLATANFSANTVSVLLGRGDNTFQPAVSFTVGSQPVALVTGDFNGDGTPDLAVADSGDNTIAVLLGRGDGTFIPAVTYRVGHNPSSLAVGDFDGDHHLDLAVTNHDDNTVMLLRGAGDGTFRIGGPGGFAQSILETIGAGPRSMTTVDFDRNGILSLAIASDDRTLTVYQGLGNGSFTFAGLFPTTTSSDPTDIPRQVAAGDFNNDGQTDLITVNSDNDFTLFLRDGATFDLSSVLAGSSEEALTVGDFNNDGNLDLAATGVVNNSVDVFLGDGQGDFTPAPFDTVYVGLAPVAVAAGDFNNDGTLDLVTAASGAQSVTIALNRGGGQLQLLLPENGIAIRHVPLSADLDGDGIADTVILSRTGDILFRRGLPGGSNHFAPPVVVNPGQPARDLTLLQMAGGPAIAAIDVAGNMVSVWSWSPSARAFQRTATLATGQQPVRLAAADLNHDGLDDLVVANAIGDSVEPGYFENSITIALQTPSGSFAPPTTQFVGAAPSGIAFADLDGQDGPDIVVSDQFSGDVTLLFNDAAHSFSRQFRYRAGTGLSDSVYDLFADDHTIQSQMQTTGVVAGHFISSTSMDLVVVNRGLQSFTLLPGQGGGHYADPQAGNPYPTSADPGQVVSYDFDGDGHPDLAILMEDRSEIWIYHNNGDGTFASPVKVPAGNGASGFSVAQVKGRLALLVGNEFGDILTLLADGHGGFAPDRADLQNLPLAVGTDPRTGREYVVVADQQLDQVAVYFRKPGTNQFDSPVPLDSHTQTLLAPGAVQMFTVPGDPSPYLVVANSLGNNILVFHFDPATGSFEAPASYPVGFDPVAVTVADLNGDRVPDLLVANQGSNDVSVLIGSLAPSANPWTATPYQRLSSGGSGPIGVLVRQQSDSSHGPDLIVTNSDGNTQLLPGIGTAGQGSGFFLNTPRPVNLGETIVQALFDPATGDVLVLGSDGSIAAFDGNLFRPVFDPAGRGVVRVALAGEELVAALDDGAIELLEQQPNGVFRLLAEADVADQVRDLEALEGTRGLEVFVTRRGSEVPLLLTGADFITVVAELPLPAVSAEGTSLPNTNLVLVATLLTRGLSQPLPEASSERVAEEVFAPVLPPPRGRTLVPDPAANGRGDDPEVVEEAGKIQVLDPPRWQLFRLAAREELQQQRAWQQFQDRIEEALNLFKGLLKQVQRLQPPAETPVPVVPQEVEMDEVPTRDDAAGNNEAERDGTKFVSGVESQFLDRHLALLGLWLVRISERRRQEKQAWQQPWARAKREEGR